MALRATQHGTGVGRRGLWMWCAAGLLFFLAGCSFLSLYRYADWIILCKVCRVTAVMRPYLEALA